MKKVPKVSLPEKEGESPFQRFEQLAKRVVGVHRDSMKKQIPTKEQPPIKPTHIA